MVGGLKKLEKIMIFEEQVLTFVDIVQSSRLEKINQRSILGFRFFNVEKYGKHENLKFHRKLTSPGPK